MLWFENTIAILVTVDLILTVFFHIVHMRNFCDCEIDKRVDRYISKYKR